MNQFTNVVTRVVAGLAVATPLLLGTVSAQAATPSCENIHVSSLDKRLAAKADQGAGPLRTFVEIVQPIYQMNMTEALVRADHARAVAARCNIVTASR